VISSDTALHRPYAVGVELSWSRFTVSLDTV